MGKENMLKAITLTSALCLTLSGLTLGSADAMPGVSGLQKPAAGYLKIKANADDPELRDAMMVIDVLAVEAIGFLGDTDLSEEEKQQKFKKLLEKSFDMDVIAQFALGRYWRQVKSEEKKEYLRLFNDMVVNVYTRRFSEYDNQKLRLDGARKQGEKDIVVTSYIVSPGEPEVRVDWRLREKSGQFKIIDVMVEGVSMALTQRSDFASVIQRGGGKVDVLLSHLKKQG